MRVARDICGARTAEVEPEATDVVSGRYHHCILSRQLASVVVEPRPLPSINSVKSIVQLTAVVHSVLNTAIEPKFEGEEVSFVNDWGQHGVFALRLFTVQ